MPSSTYQLVYASSATIPFEDGELRTLLESWQGNNARAGLTGILLYKDGNIMQVLEGEELAVMTMYNRIAADPRHRGVLPLIKGPVVERNFSSWSMAYRNLDLDAASIPGFSEFLNSSLTSEEFANDPSRCQRLLMIFKEKLR